jgi:plastocyanin
MLACAACSTSAASSSSDDASAPDDASVASDAPATIDASDDGSDEDAGAIVDAAPALDVVFNYNDCTNIDFDDNDETAPDASRTIVFSFHASSQQYAPRCMKVRATETVRWQGDFADHPLVSAGGDIPNAIDTVMVNGTTGTVTFPNVGWYGFECQIHESPSEYGAILVVP